MVVVGCGWHKKCQDACRRPLSRFDLSFGALCMLLVVGVVCVIAFEAEMRELEFCIVSGKGRNAVFLGGLHI